MRRTVDDHDHANRSHHAVNHGVGYRETSESDQPPLCPKKSTAPDRHRSMTSDPSHSSPSSSSSSSSSSSVPYVVTVGIDNSFPLPPSPLVDQKPYTPDSTSSQSRYHLFSPQSSSRSSVIVPQIGLTYEADHTLSSDWLHEPSSDEPSSNRTPSPMFPKDSPSSSNRSSTSSSNSSGYVGSNSQVNHSLPLGRQGRLSGHSSESGLSSIASSRYSYLSGSSSSQSSLDNLEESGGRSSSSTYINELFQRGLKETEVLYSWLNGLRLTECHPLFVQAGYDMPTISRMTPEDLTAIGITQPAIRKRLTSEISKLHISDGIPNHKPNTLLEWLQCIGLVEYYKVLAKDGYEDLDRVLDIIWEDLEEIGIHKLGHQKKIMLAIDRLKKLKLSMQRLSSVDQNASTEMPNRAKPAATSCTATPPMADAPRPLRRSLSGENVAVVPRDKNLSRLASHPPSVTSSMTSSVTSSLPQPEVVTIQINNSSRSWTGGVVDRDVDEYSDSSPAITYESFYGNPLLDFRCLRKEADGDTTPTNEKAASSEELDRTKGGATSTAFRFRPQLAPKPKLSCRMRRASGGSSLYSETEFASSAFDWNFPRVDVRDAAVYGCRPPKGSPEFSRPTSAGVLSHSVPNTPAHGRTSTKSAPPPLPKRTNSVKGDSLSSAVDSESFNVAEVCQPLSSPLRVKSGKWEMANMASASECTESFARVDFNVHSQTPAVVSQPDRGLTTSLMRQTAYPASAGSSKEKNLPSAAVGSGSPDCSTLPFANENIGTIRQKAGSKLVPMTNVVNEAKLMGAFGRDDAQCFVDSAEKTLSPSKPDAVATGKKPIRPIPKQKPKLSGNRESKDSNTSIVGSDVAREADDVFNDIDDLFQGLSQELDQMLTFQG